ncbi:unnamed protein product [Hermetia illucens]|uniref:Sodium/calcium exchanger membrane region domain-containing protein n=1 Tax=Hermetia illucens TaxID=343691 RepID=A0A7R8UW21_HERIL|nr:sodium/potassium/calcium exchanger 4-like [Hermetia illucens]CAD7088177.1 unnamed protein product [Hermetia illucens]
MWTTCACAIVALCFSVGFSSGHLSNDVGRKLVSLSSENGNGLSVISRFIGRQSELNATTNNNCSDSSGSGGSFPADLFTDEQLKNGAFILYLVGAIYSFSFLACICNYYFLPTVECICEDLNIPKDVGAAIVMATAACLPDFFTNSISTLITNSQMGMGSIIGGLMYNTLAVPGIAGLAIKKPIQLDWWPVCRDSVIYIFHTCVLMFVVWGGIITFTESCILLFFCILYYVTIILTNYKMKNRLRTFVEDQLNCCITTRYDFKTPGEKSAKGKLPFHKKHNERPQSGVYVITPTEFTLTSPVNTSEDNHKVEEDSEGSGSSPFKLPRGNFISKVWWWYSWPIRFILACACPNPKTNRRFYMVTFFVCIVFIALNAYFILWMLTIFGSSLGIPAVVSGLTILAAGSATPEAFACAISLRRGESGIGISNALGANTLAIVFSLGMPWFIKSIMNMQKGIPVIYISTDSIEYVIGILILSTVTLFAIFAISGFRLRRTTGLALLVAYFVYISLQVLIEMDVIFPSDEGC